jgi:hypothetical protein
MKLLKTHHFGIGIAFDYGVKELSIHVFIWCLEIQF